MRVSSLQRPVTESNARFGPRSLALLIGVTLLTGCAAEHGATASPDRASSTATFRSERPSLIDAPRVRRMAEPGWVEVEASVLASDEESPAAARRRALERARRAAVEYVAGVSVQSSVVTFDHVSDQGTAELLQALTTTQSDALVVDEKLLDSGVSMSGDGGYHVRVKLAARVLVHGQGDADFETEVRLNGTRFRPGERVALAVRVSQTARIYVLALSDDGAVVLLPNRHMPDTRFAADTWLEFPGQALTDRGVVLEASLASGRARSLEALIVVALRGRRRLDDVFPASGAAFHGAEGSEAMRLASEFLSPLLGVPASDWTFDQIVYTIERD